MGDPRVPVRVSSRSGNRLRDGSRRRRHGSTLKKPHKQTWVKVNASVDDGVAELVRSLNAFPRLQTIESCQGRSDRPAWVCFSYGEYWNDSWRDLADFVLGYLGPGLARAVGDGASITLRVTNSGLVRAELTVRPGATHATVRGLRRLLALRR